MTTNVRQPAGKQSAEATAARTAERRRALIRLGLAVGAAYVAPTVLSIDRSARAMGPSCSKKGTC